MPGTCAIQYDPLRIVPESEVRKLPATQRPVTAFVRCLPGGELWQGEMRFAPAATLLLDEDSTGGGTMLTTGCPVPNACDELECWFSYVDDSGNTLWDSAMGANYRLRVPSHAIRIEQAEIEARANEAQDLFRLRVESVGTVDSVLLRWRYANAINSVRHECPLTPAADGDKKVWTPPGGELGVSWDTPLAFDLVYYVAGHKHTDDNQGNWYVVSRPN